MAESKMALEALQSENYGAGSWLSREDQKIVCKDILGVAVPVRGGKKQTYRLTSSAQFLIMYRKVYGIQGEIRMRVIAGSAKRTQLITLEGMDTRPTTDRIKETLFNIIAPFLYDCMFLDLFAGSGGIGIEALSRGAMEAVFVENHPEAVACIKANLKAAKLSHKAMTISSDVMTALYKLEGEKQFDYIFMDPPYGRGLERPVLSYLADSALVAEEGVVILEAARETRFDYLGEIGMSVIKTKEYKTNQHIFMEPSGRKEAC